MIIIVNSIVHKHTSKQYQIFDEMNQLQEKLINIKRQTYSLVAGVSNRVSQS